MDHPQIHSQIYSGLRHRTAGDSVYQIAIIVAALLLVISASLL